jgi:OOP family OmpA-OmpF porin
MTQSSRLKLPLVAFLSLIGLIFWSTTVTAQTVKVEGLIQGRNGDTMILKTSDRPNVVVQLTDSTDVGQVQGVFKARKKDMSMAALILACL